MCPASPGVLCLLRALIGSCPNRSSNQVGQSESVHRLANNLQVYKNTPNHQYLCFKYFNSTFVLPSWSDACPVGDCKRRATPHCNGGCNLSPSPSFCITYPALHAAHLRLRVSIQNAKRICENCCCFPDPVI